MLIGFNGISWDFFHELPGNARCPKSPMAILLWEVGFPHLPGFQPKKNLPRSKQRSHPRRGSGQLSQLLWQPQDHLWHEGSWFRSPVIGQSRWIYMENNHGNTPVLLGVITPTKHQYCCCDDRYHYNPSYILCKQVCSIRMEWQLWCLFLFRRLCKPRPANRYIYIHDILYFVIHIYIYTYYIL